MNNSGDPLVLPDDGSPTDWKRVGREVTGGLLAMPVVLAVDTSPASYRITTEQEDAAPKKGFWWYLQTAQDVLRVLGAIFN
jgi:hypothetical protein